MKTEFREDGQNYVMTFEGRLDTPASRLVERDMQVLPGGTRHAGALRLRGP